MENIKITQAKSDTLMELLHINHDRFINYTKAVSILDPHKDKDLTCLLENYGQQAQQFKSQIISLLEDYSDTIEEDQTIDRTWFEVTDTHVHGPRITVLTACTKGEEENQTTYQIAIAHVHHDNPENDHISEIIHAQAQLQSLVYTSLKELLERENSE